MSFGKVTPLGAIRLATVFAQAAMGSDPNKVSASRLAQLDMKMRKQFNAAAAYPQILPKGQFLFFGDTNHTDIRIHEFFYSRKNVDAMAKAGVKHVFPEIEPQYQDLVDLVATGALDEDGFAAAMLLRGSKSTPAELAIRLQTAPAARESFDRLRFTGQGVRLMHQSGMKVHCLDDRSNLKEKDMEQIGRFMGGIKNYIADKGGKPPVMHGKIFMRYLIDNADKMKSLQIDPKFLKARIDDDPALAKRMLAVAGNERAAILFGAGHAMAKNSLYECLGKERTARVDIYGSMDLYADRMMYSQRGPNPPDYVHILESDKLYQFKGLKGVSP